MKKILFIMLSAIFSNLVSAAHELEQAMFSNSEKLTEIKSECGGQLGKISSKKIEDGVYQHKLTILTAKPMEGFTVKCLVTIDQDFTPTWSDGEVEYQLDIKKL